MAPGLEHVPVFSVTAAPFKTARYRVTLTRTLDPEPKIVAAATSRWLRGPRRLTLSGVIERLRRFGPERRYCQRTHGCNVQRFVASHGRYDTQPRAKQRAGGAYCEGSRPSSSSQRLHGYDWPGRDKL